MANRPGKWAEIVKTLEKAPIVPLERREVVQAIIDEIMMPAFTDEEFDELEVVKALVRINQIYDEVIEALKRAAPGASQHSANYARAFGRLRHLRDVLGQWDAAASLLLEAYTSLMIEAMEKEGVTGHKLADGSSISTHGEPWPSVFDAEAFRVWCLEQKDAEGNQRYLKQMTLHPSTTASLVKQMLEGGLADPPGIKSLAKTVVRFTPGK